MVQLNVNFTYACEYMRARTRFTRVKIYNVECIFFIARGFFVCTCAITSSGTLDMHHTSKLIMGTC